MKSLLDQAGLWFESGREVALATVIRTWRSSPRQAGAMMAITDQGEISGSVSGGCVESAVIDTAQQVLAEGGAARLHFGVAHEEAWEVGLSCGGEIDVFIRRVTPEHLESWRDAIKKEERFCIALVTEGDGSQRGLDWSIFGSGEVIKIASEDNPPEELRTLAASAALNGKTDLIRFDTGELQEVFLQVIELPRKLVLVGGVHIAIPLSSLADTLGFEVTVIDPRRLFGTAARFPGVKRLLQEWPGEAFEKITLTGATAVVMLTHDPKIDDPAIKIVLESPAFYLGALGSRKTHQKRLKRLTDQGVAPDRLKDIYAPVGLDLGASSPEEIALAIMAEVIKVWHQKG